MGKATNKYELSKRLSTCYGSNSNDNNSLKHYGNTNCDVIHMECNKPLQSKLYVSSNSKPKFDLHYNSDRHYGVYRAVGNLWLCRDRQITQMSECEKEQWRLFRQLKREYEQEQKLLQDKTISDTVVTAEDKARNRAQKIAYNLNWYNIDKMYGIQRKW